MVWRGAGYKMQETGEPDDGADNFFKPGPGRSTASAEFGNISLPVSLYTQYLELRPNLKRLVLLGLAGMGLFAVRRLGR